MSRARVTFVALTRVLLLGLLFVVGCKAASYGASAPMDASYNEGAPGGGGGYGYAGDYGGEADEEYYRMDGVDTGVASTEVQREYAAGNKQLAEPPAPPMEPASPTPQPTVPKQASNTRQVIYTATMQVSVYDVEHSIAQAEALPDRLGGWLHQRMDNQLVLRIPAEHLREAMDIIAELGVVDYRLLEALDVTAQYTDLESRIRVLTEMHAQLTKLLAQAKTVEQALEIRKALDEITLELELARARMRELAKSIAFSTLIVQFVARGPDHAIPSSNDPFPWVIELGVEATEYR